MSESLQNQVRDFILETFLFTSDPSALGLDDSLLDKGIVDSTGMLEIILYLEEQLVVQMGDHEMVPENLDSVNNIVRFIECKRKVA